MNHGESLLSESLQVFSREYTTNDIKCWTWWMSIAWSHQAFSREIHHWWHWMLKSKGASHTCSTCAFLKEKKMLRKTFQPFVKLHLNLLLLFFQSTISLPSFLFLWEETSKQCWEAITASEVVNIHSITWDTPLTPSQKSLQPKVKKRGRPSIHSVTHIQKMQKGQG